MPVAAGTQMLRLSCGQTLCEFAGRMAGARNDDLVALQGHDFREEGMTGVAFAIGRSATDAGDAFVLYLPWAEAKASR